MFKKPEPVAKKPSANDATRNVILLSDRRSLLEKIKSDRDQYEFTDTGVTLNPYRFLSLKSVFKGKDHILQPSKHLETDPSSESFSI